MGIYDITIYDLIKRNAGLFSRRPAWHEVDDGRTISFEAYRREVDRLASGLQQKGLVKGDRIALVGKNSYEFFLVYGATAAIGAIAVPVNWRLAKEEVAYILQDAQPKALFVDEEFQNLVHPASKDLSFLKTACNLKSDQGTLDRFSELTASRQPPAPVQTGWNDAFVIIHTAAVSGYPRGAVLSHGNLQCSNLHLMHCFGTTERDVHLNLLPLFHIAGLGMAMQSFHAGAVNVNVSKFDADQAVALIEEKKATMMFDFAPILESILDAREKTNADIRCLDRVMGIDSAQTIERYQQASGGTFYTLYGQTETSLLVSWGAYNDCPGAAGRPIALADMQLVDDHDQPVPIGQTGEIVMRGPMVFKGYWGLDEDNAYTFRNQWHHTGDLGRMDENGFLWYAGRKPEKELIKTGGENVYPAEVENVILKHPDITAVVVFGVPDPKWKESIKAVCVRAPQSDLTAQELTAFIGERIARYKRPRQIEFVDELPCRQDGSVDRQKVKQQHGAAE